MEMEVLKDRLNNTGHKHCPWRLPRIAECKSSVKFLHTTECLFFQKDKKRKYQAIIAEEERNVIDGAQTQGLTGKDLLTRPLLKFFASGGGGWK